MARIGVTAVGDVSPASQRMFQNRPAGKNTSLSSSGDSTFTLWNQGMSNALFLKARQERSITINSFTLFI
jgi:uncharacterized protein YpbB